jgi:hypothetical protein
MLPETAEDGEHGWLTTLPCCKHRSCSLTAVGEMNGQFGSLCSRPPLNQVSATRAELFNVDVGRLDSQRSQQVQWRDSGEFGEDAWLAAGAPSDASGRPEVAPDRQALQTLAEASSMAERGEDAEPHDERVVLPPTLARKSPFQQD